MMILILKLLALLATGVFAILGMWAEHHDTKKLAKSFSFWAVALTAFLSGLLLFIDTYSIRSPAGQASVLHKASSVSSETTAQRR